jgi:hypothetical protein
MGCKFRNAMSPSGIAIDVLKSGIQKYARRGMEEEGLRCVIEVDLLALGGEDLHQFKSKRTNLLTRLIVCWVEDCVEPGWSGAFLDLARTANGADRQAISAMTALLNMFVFLSNARKGRLVSVAKLYAPPTSEAVSALERNVAFMTKYAGAVVRPPIPSYSSAVYVFESLLVKMDVKAVTLMFVLDEERDKKSDDGSVVLKRVCTRPRLEGILRKYLPAHILVPLLELRDILPGGNAERVYFLYHAVMLAVFRPFFAASSASSSRAPPPPLPPLVDASTCLKRYRARCYEIQEAREPARLHPFCYDVHTSEGRCRGADVARFASEGAVVMNEHPFVTGLATRWHWRDMYATFRGAEQTNGSYANRSHAEQENKKRSRKEERDEALVQKKEDDKEDAATDTEVERCTHVFTTRVAPSVLNGDGSTSTSSPFERGAYFAIVGGLPVYHIDAQRRPLHDKISLIVSDLRPLLDKVCGTRPMTFSASLVSSSSSPVTSSVVIKGVLDCLKNGFHCVIVDRCKKAFGLLDVEARLVCMDAVTVMHTEKTKHKRTMSSPGKSKTTQSHEIRYSEGESRSNNLFLVMRRVDGDARSVADSGGSLRLSASVDTSREYIKIGLYRSLFGVTDFNPRNVLITDDGRLYSIDENSMFERNFVFQPDKARSSPAAAYTKRGGAEGRTGACRRRRGSHAYYRRRRLTRRLL